MQVSSRGAFLAALLVLWSPSPVRAEPFSVQDGNVFFNTVLSTHGTFFCRGEVRPMCTGSGDSITITSGDGHATITFTGVTDTALEVGNQRIPVTLGLFETSITPGFLFPTRPSRFSPILQFNFFMDVASPVATQKRKVFTATGGRPSLNISPAVGTSWNMFIPTGPNPPGSNYTAIAFAVNSPILLSDTNSVKMTAKVGAVPEPGTLVLLGSVVGALGLRRFRAVRGLRRSRSFSSPHSWRNASVGSSSIARRSGSQAPAAALAIMIAATPR
jgi:hypothetical protein